MCQNLFDTILLPVKEETGICAIFTSSVLSTLNEEWHSTAVPFLPQDISKLKINWTMNQT